MRRNLSELDFDTIQTCDQFTCYHRDRCKEDIVRNRRYVKSCTVLIKSYALLHQTFLQPPCRGERKIHKINLMMYKILTSTVKEVQRFLVIQITLIRVPHIH